VLKAVAAYFAQSPCPTKVAVGRMVAGEGVGNALTACLNEDADWQWPVIYQMGLCFERLRLASRAAEAYRFIVEAAKKMEAENRKPAESAANIVQMARWRGEHLVWAQDAQDKIQHFLGDPLAPLPAGFGGMDRPSAAAP
jgi:hypothetical protein